MTIGGQINPIIGTDFGNDLYEVDGAGIGFVTGMIPVPPVNGKRSDFYINPLNANIDFSGRGFRRYEESGDRLSEIRDER